ncbi:Solute carrier family 49 member A3 [Lamellibrachia satsuma]|nr:Solute carrier family 49 member A3 [Lamellibrachia satsuma]
MEFMYTCYCAIPPQLSSIHCCDSQLAQTAGYYARLHRFHSFVLRSGSSLDVLQVGVKSAGDAGFESAVISLEFEKCGHCLVCGSFLVHAEDVAEEAQSHIEISDAGEGDMLLHPSSYPETPSSGYRVYKRRWLVLAVVALLNISNGMLWITFSPIADVTAAYYDVGDMAVNWLSLIFLVVCIPLGLFAAWLLDTLGLRTGIVLAAWVNIAGAVLRVVSCLHISHDHRFALVLTGQAMAACAQPFMLFAPTKVAAVWFKDTWRATANMIASIANPVGILLANLISPAVVGDSSHPADLLLLMVIYTIPAAVVVIMATFGVCSSVPPTPPTASAAEISQPFFRGLKMIACSRSYWILAVCFGAGLALFTTLSTLLQQILCPHGYTDSFAGLCGALLFGVGVLGAGLASLFVDRTRKFEEVSKISFALAALCCVGFMVVRALQFYQMFVWLKMVIFSKRT